MCRIYIEATPLITWLNEMRNTFYGRRNFLKFSQLVKAGQTVKKFNPHIQLSSKDGGEQRKDDDKVTPRFACFPMAEGRRN